MDEVHLAVFHGSGIPMTIRKICITEIKVAPNEILGKMLYSSRCGSDLHTIDGRRIEPTPRYFWPFCIHIVCICFSYHE